MDTLKAELGEIFVNGIKPLMTTAKVREYNSFWNWGVQEALHMIHSDDPVKKCSDQVRRKPSFPLPPVKNENDHFTKTGSGQT